MYYIVYRKKLIKSFHYYYYNNDISNNAQCNSNAGENHEEFPLLKKGINLPQSDKEWSTANEYFKFFKFKPSNQFS